MRGTVPANVLLGGEDKFSNKKFLFKADQLIEQDLQCIINFDHSKILPLRGEVEGDKLRVTGNNTYFKLGLKSGAKRFVVDIPELEIGDFKEVEYDIQPVEVGGQAFNAYAVFRITEGRQTNLEPIFRERLSGKAFHFKHFQEFSLKEDERLNCLGISFSHENYRIIGYPHTNRLLNEFFRLFEDENTVLRSIDGIKIEEYFLR